jgi:hypothetical protein
MKTYELMDQLGRDARNYEVPLRDIETRLADVAAQEAQLDAAIIENLARFGRMQMEHGADIGQEASTVLRLRAAEEREQRADLKVIEKEIDELLRQAQEANAGIELAGARLRDYLYGEPDYVAAVKTRTTVRAARDWLRANGEELNYECDRKLPEYERHPLYTYLLKRGYDEPHYRGSGITRALDGWVARLCHYRVNRVNHLALLGMREELARQKVSHAEQLVQTEAAIANLTAQAERKAGMDTARQRLQAAQERIADAKRRAGELNAKLAAYADCTDPRYLRARELVAKRLGEQSIESLFEKARATASLADDELVIHLSEMYERRKRLQAERRELSASRAEIAEKYNKVKELEREVRAQQQKGEQGSYDGLDWGKLFMGYMSGTVNSRDVEKSLMRHLKRGIKLFD